MKRRPRSVRHGAAAAAAVVLLAAGPGCAADEPRPAQARPPGEARRPPEGGEPPGVTEFAGEDWREASPESQGLDRERLARGIERLGALAGARSVLVVRYGRIVAERSFSGPGLAGRIYDIKSASKSLLSALVGIALDRGWIATLDSPLERLLPDYAHGLPPEKRGITLADLLSMRSGLASTSGEHYGAWVSTDDWTRAALERPMVSAPGTDFTYSTGNSHLVSAILTEASGMSTVELAREVLLEPVGMRVDSWQRSPEGYYFGGNNLRMSPRDLARLGQLYLQEGRWNGRQVVPAEWVRRSTERHARGWPGRYGGYGYLWWLPPDDPWSSFAAIGYGGQFLYVVPELRMLVVMTSTLESKGAEWDRQVFEILREEIFGSAPCRSRRCSNPALIRGLTPAP